MALEQNEELQMLLRLEMADYDDLELCVFLGEATVDNHTVQHKYGWAQMGMPCVSCGAFLQ